MPPPRLLHPDELELLDPVPHNRLADIQIALGVRGQHMHHAELSAGATAVAEGAVYEGSSTMAC